MRLTGVLTLVLGLSLTVPGWSWASSWGGLEPGVTTQAQVRERYGAPSKETKQKVEGYDTTTWVYEGNKAPVGMARMTVDLGILKPDGFKPDLRARVRPRAEADHLSPSRPSSMAGDSHGGRRSGRISHHAVRRRPDRGVREAGPVGGLHDLHRAPALPGSYRRCCTRRSGRGDPGAPAARDDAGATPKPPASPAAPRP